MHDSSQLLVKEKATSGINLKFRAEGLAGLEILFYSILAPRMGEGTSLRGLIGHRIG